MKLRVRVLALTIGFTLLAAFALGALEVKEGLVKLVVSETAARVSVYRLVDIAKGRYEPLLFDQDPRTSFMTLSIDGRQVKLGDSSDYRFTIGRGDKGVTIDFRSSFCSVRQSLDFVKSEGSALVDGLRVTLELENVSEKDELLGLRYVLDTWLGEKSGVHFSTDRRPKISEESDILVSAPDRWIVSPGERASFMAEIKGTGIDGPDRILLANWKRLADTTWAFDANAQRNFTLVPYSINDSAIAMYWEPAPVARGGTRRMSFIMGAYNEKGYPAGETKSSSTEQLFASTVLGAQAPDAATAIAGDLVLVRDLISRIDRAVSSGTKISADELSAWRKILDRLEERKKGY